MTNWLAWYGPQPDGSPPLYNPDTDDVDKDEIPDVLEDGMGFNPSEPDSDFDGRDDGDELAYRAECEWQVGSADPFDWSNPGHQF